MRVHVVGAGPTGMSIAWEVLRSTDHEVIIYDRKPSAGGSWWEPETDIRDLHAHRIVFDNAFVNTDSLFREMGISWDDIFQPAKTDVYKTIFKSLGIKDYLALTALAGKVLARQSRYKSVSLKDAIGSLTESGERLIRTLTFIMDGVDWETMSAYEFVNNFDHVGLSKQYTQRVSGKVMCDAMQTALLEKGATFMFNTHLESVNYLDDGYEATFADGVKINDGLLVLCVDNSKALELVGDNWGEDVTKQIGPSTYGCINVLLDYDEPVTIPSDLEIGMNTVHTLQPVVLSDGKTISCVICDLTDEVLAMEPEALKAEVIRELNLPEPTNARIGWGAEWNGNRWKFEQSSGVLSLHGQVPFFGKNKHVALCGMMSPRNTPYSSIEAAIEVGRSFCKQEFDTRGPLQPIRITLVLFVLIALILITIYTRKP
jgi:regulator of RNase E activity RraB